MKGQAQLLLLPYGLKLLKWALIIIVILLLLAMLGIINLAHFLGFR